LPVFNFLFDKQNDLIIKLYQTIYKSANAPIISAPFINETIPCELKPQL